jgi:hypothetical protein
MNFEQQLSDSPQQTVNAIAFAIVLIVVRLAVGWLSTVVRMPADLTWNCHVSAILCSSHDDYDRKPLWVTNWMLSPVSQPVARTGVCYL